MTHIIVIGGGAAGLMAAGTAAEEGAHVLLLEKNTRPGRKLAITGKGRCNVTNDCDVSTVLANVPTNPRFLYSALGGCAPADVMAFFEREGVPLKTERGSRVFPLYPQSIDQSSTISGVFQGFFVDNLIVMSVFGIISTGKSTKSTELSTFTHLSFYLKSGVISIFPKIISWF